MVAATPVLSLDADRPSEASVHTALIAAARTTLSQGTTYADFSARPLAVPLPPEPPSFLPHPHTSLSDPSQPLRAALSALLGDSALTHTPVLTAGATDSLRLLSERLPWAGSSLLLHAHAHRSLLGLRGPAIAAGAPVTVLPSANFAARLEGAGGNVVAAFPAACNLTGSIYPFASWASLARRGGAMTIVDGAALAAHTPIPAGALDDVDLFVASVYKVVGAPTGVGVLLVRRGSLAEAFLVESAGSAYFGGGRGVEAMSADGAVFEVAGLESLECGTGNVDGWEVAARALRVWGKGLWGGREAARVFREGLDGIAVVYSDKGEVGRGPVVAFSVLSEGEFVGHGEVRDVLLAEGVVVRAGQMCNPGACEEALGFGAKEVREAVLRGWRCENGMDFIDGRAMGVVRASFGWASTVEDARRILEVLTANFCGEVRGVRRRVGKGTGRRVYVERLFIYPVKGCGGQEVSSIGQRKTWFGSGERNGINCAVSAIEGDREFVFMPAGGRGPPLSRKSTPSLAAISASIITSESSLLLRVIRTNGLGQNDPGELSLSSSSSHCFRVQSQAWLSSATSGSARGYLTASASGVQHSNRGASVHIVNIASCGVIAGSLGHDWDAWRVARAARANILIGGVGPWDEEGWVGGRVDFGEGGVVQAIELCTRCSGMNDIGSAEPLRTVVRVRKEAGLAGRVCFGIVGRWKTGTVTKMSTGCRATVTEGEGFTDFA